ncbi:MAG: ABC transporter substrate-binding protein [Planctomycetes bacterium]|nr:ABC transporter substrate-binding protein [Planctomycetota bacterium]
MSENPTSEKTLLLGHSPDPDDAFMFYGLAAGKIDCKGWTFKHILEDIQTLNDRSTRGELHITAVSVHAYPSIASRYALTSCGSSMGDGYGPLVVARDKKQIEDLRGAKIAVPGMTTTAILALKLLLGADAFEPVVVDFDKILNHVALGHADAGLIIHEGQLTYSNHSLHKIVDLGEWWKEEHDLPLPLGANAILRDMGTENMNEVAGILKESICYGLEHRSEAVDHALKYARDMGKDLADRFVGMYVNEWTVDYGEVGRKAMDLLLRKGAEAGIVAPIDAIDYVG